MPNKQPYYHQTDIRIDIILTGDDPQILFCAYGDRSEAAKRRLEKIDVQVYSADAEPGDPADLL